MSQVFTAAHTGGFIYPLGDYKLSNAPRILNDQWTLKRGDKMKVLKVKLFTSKTSYKEVENEVNKFLATVEYNDVKIMTYNDTPDTASVLISYLVDEDVVESTTVVLKARTKDALGSMIDEQIRNADNGSSLILRRYEEDGYYCAEITED